MAAETFRIEIPINVEDNTEPGVSSATKKMNAFDKQAEKTKKRLDEMNKSKWKIAVEAVDKVTSVISKIGTTVKGVAGKAWSFTVSAIDKVTAPVKSMISVLGNLLGVSSAVSAVLGGLTVKNALDASAESSRMLTQLQVSAKNMGIDENGIQKILDKASAIQSATMYSDDAFTGAAAELATYFEDSDAIVRMMDTVADYAAGMSGGVELSTEEIVDYTTNLAKMTTGAYDAMTKKGFEVTDAQKKILETGTDMEKVAVIESIIKENWEGMAEAMSNTPTGQMVRLKNSWSDISKMIGNKLTPGVTNFFKMLNTKMPSVSKLIEGVAGKAGSWLEDFVPTIEGWIDTAVIKVEEFSERANKVFSSSEFKNADFFGKVSIAWNKIIAEPFNTWWESTGKAWFADKLGRVGESIGTGLTSGLLALLGIDISKTIEDGTSVGGAFIEGFKKGFDTEKITEALKEWANNNKEIVIGIGAVIGFNLITGLAGKLNQLTSLFKGKGDSDSGSSGIGDLMTNCTTATVNGNIVNVYGKAVNDTGSESGLGNAIKGFLPTTAGAAGGKLLTSGGGQILLEGGSSSVPMLTGEVAGGAATAAGGLTSSGSWLSKLLTLGSSSTIEAADGTLLAVQGGVGGTLGNIGSFFGSTATTAAGSAAAGAASTAGILGIAAGTISSIVDVVQGIGKKKEGDSKGSKDEFVTAGTKVGMMGAGAGIGAAIGSIIPGAGTAIGALVGGGIGGIVSLFAGDKAGKAISDSTDEGGWLSNAWSSTKKFFTEDVGKFFTETIPEGWSDLKGNVSSFFTETIPEGWNTMWNDIGNFFKEDVPYAVGYACGKIEVFFTEDVPQFFSDLWNDISTFFSETVPTWASNTWNNHIVPFFTEKIPKFFSDLLNDVATFFTDTLPTWASDVWNNNIIPFFTEDIPQFFSDLMNDIATFFTETIPTWASNVWTNNIVPFFTEKIPGFFNSLWNNVTSFVTETIPTWASSIFGSISNFFGKIGDWLGGIWDSVSGFFSKGYSDATSGAGYGESKHAWGGIMNSPHVGMVAEQGPEAIIPLSPSKNARGFDLWMKTGQLLGVKPYADGDIVGDTSTIASETVTTGGGSNNFDIKLEINPEFVIEGRDGMDEETLVSVIKSKLREMVDDIGDELAERLARIFANMPVKGTV